ncbi:MAG: hypothetical protein KGJ13_08085 [Patescibacteria group bacterium]|nr:hypothetical protein [Patescibacteria group bacterium]
MGPSDIDFWRPERIDPPEEDIQVLLLRHLNTVQEELKDVRMELTEMHRMIERLLGEKTNAIERPVPHRL